MTEHRFATGADAIDPVAPAPAGRAPATVTLGSLCRGVVDVVRGMAGLDAYERYCAHQAARHPDEPPLTRAQFWRERWDDAEQHPKPRCC